MTTYQRDSPAPEGASQATGITGIMSDIYLTKQLKKKYSADFRRVLQCRDEYWKPDEGLPAILTAINANPYVQTLYSRRASVKNPAGTSHSYLEICYSRSIELILFRDILSELSIEYNHLHDSLFYYFFNLPRPNENYGAGSLSPGLGCTDDPEYFRVNTIRLNLESYDHAIHNAWWEKLRVSLSAVRP